MTAGCGSTVSVLSAAELDCFDDEEQDGDDQVAAEDEHAELGSG